MRQRHHVDPRAALRAQMYRTYWRQLRKTLMLQTNVRGPAFK